MSVNILVRIRELGTMRVPELKRRYAETFGEETRSNNRDYLVKRIAWRIQANSEGDLSERARRRAEELAADADLRRRAPSARAAAPASAADGPGVLIAPIKLPRDAAGPMPGSVIIKMHRGRRIAVRVLERGFEHEGKVYRSLSAIANEVTGSHRSGTVFFGLAGGRKNGAHSATEATR